MKPSAIRTLCFSVALALGCKTASEELPSAEATRLLAAAATVAEPTPRVSPSAASDDAPVASPAREETRVPDVIYVPTPEPVVDKMLELARVKEGDLVYDLGCGDGRIVVTAAKRYGARAVGFDIDPKRVAEARENVRRNGVEHLVRIEQRDIFQLDLTPAHVVTLYLLPSLNVKLIPQLDRMRPGSRIVSHDFDMEGVEPAEHLTMQVDGSGHDVYLFEIPLDERAE